MKKKLFFLTALAAGLLFAIGLIGGIRTEASELHTVTTHYLDADGEIQEETHDYQMWSDTTALPAATKEGVYIYLDNDVTLGSQYLIDNVEGDPERKIYIDLNGHTLYGGNNSRIICFNNNQGGVTVVVTDSSELKTGKLQGRGSHGMGGAGIYFRQGVTPNTLVLDNVTLEGAKTSNWGAGIGATDAKDGTQMAKLLVYKTTIQNCEGGNGSALFVGTQYYQTVLFDTVISNCTATGYGTIHVKNSGAVKMFGENSAIKNCTAKYGGAAYLTSGTFDMTDVAVSECTADVYGGAFYMTNSTFTMGGASTIKKCRAKGDRGGAIHAEFSTVNIKGGVIGGSTADKNYTDGAGFSAGLHMYASAFNMSGGEISYQESVYGGANVALFYQDDAHPSVGTITGGKILNGILTGSNTAHVGGNICVYGTSTLTIGSTDEANKPVISGGTNAVSGGYGGNIGLRNSSKLTVNGYAEISNGSAFYGGAVFGQSGTEINISNGVISGNHTTLDGGAIYSTGIVSITGGTIKKNYSTGGRGGAIYSNNRLTLGAVTIGGSKEDANYCASVEKQGGGIIVESETGRLSIDGATITYNYGGFCGNLVLQTGATGEFKSGTIGYGEAKKYYGGNVGLFQKSALDMSGGTIIGGKAASYGGNVAVRDAGGRFTMTAGTISDGVAGTNGGNICMASSGILGISGNSKVRSGAANGTAAGYGGGNIFATTGSQTTIGTGVEISGGTAKVGGSNIDFYAAGTAVIEGATITDGEIWQRAGSLTIKNSTIGDLKLLDGTITLTGNKYDSVKLDEGSTLEKILTEGTLKEAPAAALVADGYAVIKGAYDGYGYMIATEDKLPAFVPAISGTIAEKFGLTLQATGADLEGAEAPVLRIIRNGADFDVEGVVNTEGKYVYTFELDPEDLTDNLYPRLMVGEVIADERAEYAAVTYVKALAENDQATAELKTLLADLLEFGAAAQTYYGHNTADLANAESHRWADYQASAYAEPASIPDLAYQAGDETVSITRASLWLEDDTVAIRFKGVAPADATFKLNDEAATAEFDGTAFVLSTAALKMSEVVDAVFTATVEKDGVTSSVTYGVASYVSRIRANSVDDAMKALAERLWAYGVSAKAYY